MRPATTKALFDELGKIATAGDLMNPAVVSDSAIVDGPPAIPFTKRRGFRKLERFGPVKEAGVRDFLNAGRIRLVNKTKRVAMLARHGVKNPGAAAATLYSSELGPLKPLLDAAISDPSSVAIPTPLPFVHR